MKSWHIKVCYFLDFQTMWCITISQKNLWLWALEILFFCLTLKMYSGIRLVHFERSKFWEFWKKNLNAQNVCTIYSQYILSVDRLTTLKRSKCMYPFEMLMINPRIILDCVMLVSKMNDTTAAELILMYNDQEKTN